jgi:hypothetical protein
MGGVGSRKKKVKTLTMPTNEEFFNSDNCISGTFVKNLQSVLYASLVFQYLGLPSDVSLYICDLFAMKRVTRPFRIKHANLGSEPNRAIRIVVFGGEAGRSALLFCSNISFCYFVYFFL